MAPLRQAQGERFMFKLFLLDTLIPLRAEKGNDKQYGDKKESNNKPGVTFGQITVDPGECVGTHPAEAKPQ
jgi:hypothetical protein